MLSPQWLENSRQSSSKLATIIAEATIQYTLDKKLPPFFMFLTEMKRGIVLKLPSKKNTLSNQYYHVLDLPSKAT